MIDEEMVQPDHLVLPRQQEEKEDGEIQVPTTSDELKEIKKHLREKAVEEVERAFIVNALERNGWNVTRAAEEVGMLRPNFQALMRKYNLRARED
jgi:two-component system response regulator PilR (NtrC family)